MTMTEPETVFVSTARGGYSNIYHTDRDCRLLGRAHDVRERSLDQVSDRRECKLCAGDVASRGTHEQDHSHFQALQAAAEAHGEGGGAI
jgi:hypothetical protein